MKLTKLSLAAIVAASAMTTVAGAASLEEAIKGVQLKGFTRVRHDREDADGDKSHYNHFTTVLGFTSNVGDSVKAGLTLTYNKKEDGGKAPAKNEKGNSGHNVNELWFQKSWKSGSVKVGKQVVATPWTDDGKRGTIGDGAFALFTGIEGVTLGAVAFDQTTVTKGKELYGAAAITKAGPADIQVWFANATDIVDYAVYADVQVALGEISVEAQANFLKLNEDTSGNKDMGMFFGGKVGYEAKGFSIAAGATKNNEDQATYALAADDSSGFIFFGEQLSGEAVNNPKAMMAFVEGAFSADKLGVEGGFGMVTDGKSGDSQEVYGSVSYDYTEKFALSGLVSAMMGDAKNNLVRFEAKYSF